MRKILRNESGVSAVEFALIGPLLALMFLGIFSSWSYMSQDSDMRDSVEAVAKYYVEGGSDDAQAAKIGETAWQRKPRGGLLSIVRTKTCDNIVVTTLNCTDGSIPQEKIVATASSAWADPTSLLIFPNGLNLAESETIRVK